MGRFLRLSQTILGALASADGEGPVQAREPLIRAYQRYRSEAYDLLLDYRDEFDRVCPAWTSPEIAHAATRNAVEFAEAKLLMKALAGFLDGYVRETQLNLEAEAYARERINAERPVGFVQSRQASPKAES